VVANSCITTVQGSICENPRWSTPAKRINMILGYHERKIEMSDISIFMIGFVVD